MGNPNSAPRDLESCYNKVSMNVLITTPEKFKFNIDNAINIEYFDVSNLSRIDLIDDKYDVIVGGFELREVDFNKLSQLKFVQLISAGFDYLTISANSEIIVANARDVYSKAIAEWVLGVLIFEIKNFRMILSNQENRTWDRSIAVESISDKNILVLGTGSIGKEVAKLLKKFDILVDGVNSDGRSVDYFDKTFSLDEFDYLVSNYDTFIFCLPSNSSTSHFVNKDKIKIFNENSLLINVGRGDLITPEAIKERKDIRFVLDVHYQEPLSAESDLWKRDNLIISPHISFKSSQWKENDRVRIIV